MRRERRLDKLDNWMLNMDARYSRLDESTRKHDSELTQILIALFGNERMNIKGIVEKTRDLEKRFEEGSHV